MQHRRIYRLNAILILPRSLCYGHKPQNTKSNSLFGITFIIFYYLTGNIIQSLKSKYHTSASTRHQ